MADWHPGDPSLSGILLAACYLALAGACTVIGRRQQPRSLRRATWTGLALAFLAVAIERQVGLLDLVTATMRVKAEVAGDYALRRTGQAAVLKAIAVGAVVFAAMLAALVRGAGRYAVTATVLLTAILAYLAGKAVSLHAIDEFVFRRVDGVAVGNWIESGLAAAAAVTVALALSGMESRS